MNGTKSAILTSHGGAVFSSVYEDSTFEASSSADGFRRHLEDFSLRLRAAKKREHPSEGCGKIRV
jgi:hypothetical protein